MVLWCEGDDAADTTEALSILIELDAKALKPLVLLGGDPASGGGFAGRTGGLGGFDNFTSPRASPFK